MDELAQIAQADAVPVTVAGRDLQLTPLKVRELPGFARALQPLADQLPAVLSGDTEPGALLALLAQGDALIEAVALGAREPVETVGELEADEFLVLALAVMEVNANFFAQRLMPVLRGHLHRAAGIASGSGLSATDTATG